MPKYQYKTNRKRSSHFRPVRRHGSQTALAIMASIAMFGALVSCNHQQFPESPQQEARAKQKGPESPGAATVNAGEPPSNLTMKTDPVVTRELQDTLQGVIETCPQNYPDVVTPIPSTAELAKASVGDLLEAFKSWNPVLRTAAANELGRRGDPVVPALKEATASENWRVRAGATSALSRIVNHQVRNWKEVFPEISNRREGTEKVKARYADLADRFIALTKDPKRGVRASALSGLAALAPQTEAAAKAVLDLCADDDEYLAQSAMITLDKKFGIGKLDKKDVIPAFKKAMRSPLPRGKGHIMRQLAKMSEGDQREFIPELLYHLDWQPDRDTMFGAGGQKEAVEILTKLKVKELIPRLPKLMTKTMRGPGLFEPCLKSTMAFGEDARIILPALREHLQKLEQDLPKARQRHKAGIRKKIELIRKAVDHVESQ